MFIFPDIRWHTNNRNQRQITYSKIPVAGKKDAEIGGGFCVLHLRREKKECYFPLRTRDVSQLCGAA